MTSCTNEMHNSQAATVTLWCSCDAGDEGLLMQVDLKPASDVLAGAMARAASQSTIHPLDTLKV